MPLRSIAVLALLLSSLPLTAADDKTAPGPELSAWLSALSEAARTTNYQGVVIYRDGDMMETMRIVHRFQDGEERERLVSLSGEPREILRRGDRVTSILSAARRVLEDRQDGKGLFPSMSQDTVMSLSRHYEFRELGTARIAGRMCRGIHILPQDGLRYGYEVCADDEHKVPLRVTLMDRRGQVLEQLRFAEVAFPAVIADTALESDTDTTGYERVVQAPRPAVASPHGAWVLQQLPPGFRVTARDWRALPGTSGLVEHLLLSDGLSMVSVFSDDRALKRQALGLSRMGGVNAYGRRVGRFHVTVIGEVPPETVKQIGDAVHSAAPAP